MNSVSVAALLPALLCWIGYGLIIMIGGYLCVLLLIIGALLFEAVQAAKKTRSVTV